jgi:hypothetical protein
VQNEKKTRLVNFNCPVKLLEEFDRRTEGRLASRTAALCAGMQLLLDKLPREA